MQPSFAALYGLAALAAPLLLASVAAADAPTTPTGLAPSAPFTPPSAEMADALAELAAAEQQLAASPPCVTMCKALESMKRAADRVCDLAKDGPPSDQRRCDDARAKLEEATARVRAACPDCVVSPPYAPAGKAPAPAKPAEPTTDAGKKAEEKEAGATYAAAPPAPGEEVRAVGAGRSVTLTVDVLPLLTPPWVAQARLAKRLGPKTSLAIAVGVGSLPTSHPEGKGRAPVTSIGGELRRFVYGGFDGFGVFVGADLAFRMATLEPGENLRQYSFPLGLTVGPEIGTRLVAGAGFTVEARVGVGYLVHDGRGPGSSGERVLPIGGVGVGWTF
ncbi:MAG: hypothetical protein HYV09_06465 [Deltaproteobacteria bacterium]|nr:hypothetical protein [Deltaproteobacteria bacterium]